MTKGDFVFRRTRMLASWLRQRNMHRIWIICFFCLQAGGCVRHAPLAAPSECAQSIEYAMVNKHPLEIRLSKPQHAAAQNVLVLYSTGDGGWRARDNDMFGWFGSWNYPAAGFSSRDYIRILGYFSDSKTTTPYRLMRDFEGIIRFAEDRLGLPPESQVILVGNSRGAGLSIVVAGQGGLMHRLAGVVAVALIREEEHVLHYRRFERRSNPGTPRRELVEIKTYEYLPRLSHLPLVVIQSERDGYLPAAAARGFFGPDTALHHFRAVSARNHSFKGGVPQLRQELGTALQWIAGSSAAAYPTSSR